MGLEKKDSAEVERGMVTAVEKRLRRPWDREALRHWVETHLDLHLADAAVCAGHQVPLDYLEYVFFEKGGVVEADGGGAGEEAGGDAVIWACRGGGKTMIGAVAT